ncbi:hypothetical protein [Saccharothrix sp. Mg75]|uniref:hypothetical protein n=1 Tax=Saccharothrix sp. Mg75 TaxID=3445357 RepID=UPI003EEAF74B
MTAPDGTVHQVFFGWSDARRKHTMLAHSFGGATEAANQWEARLRNHVRLASVAGTQVPASALSYLVFDGEQQAAVVRRVGQGKSSGRENAHALVGPATVLTPSTALGLGVVPGGDLWLAKWAEGTQMTPLAAEYFTHVPDPATTLRPIAQGLRDRLVTVVAALLAHPMTPLSVLGCPDGERLAVVWALREALVGVSPGNWSFSTFVERQDDSLHGFVQVLFPSTNLTLGAVNRVVVDFDRPSPVGPNRARAEQLVAAVFGGQRPDVTVIAGSGAHAAAEPRGGHAAVESQDGDAPDRFGDAVAESPGGYGVEKRNPVRASTPVVTGTRAPGDQAVGQRATEHQGSGHQGSGHQGPGHQRVEHQEPGQQGLGQQEPGQQEAGHQELGQQGAGQQGAGHHKPGHQEPGRQGSGQGAEVWRTAPSYANGRRTPDPKADLSKSLRASRNVEEWLAEVALLRHDHITARVRKDFDPRTVDKVTDFVEFTTPSELVGRFLETLYGQGCQDLRDPAARPHALDLIARCRSDQVAVELGMRARSLGEQEVVDAAFNRWLRQGRLRGPVPPGRVHGARPVVGNKRRLVVATAVAVMSLVLIGFLLGYAAFAPAAEQPPSSTAVPSTTAAPPAEPPPAEPPPAATAQTTAQTTAAPQSGVPSGTVVIGSSDANSRVYGFLQVGEQLYPQQPCELVDGPGREWRCAAVTGRQAQAGARLVATAVAEVDVRQLDENARDQRAIAKRPGWVMEDVRPTR